MSGIAKIYVVGEIGFDTDLQDVQNQFDACKFPESIEVHIDSIGGEVSQGWAIHDFLCTQKIPVTTIVEGYCASIATVVALAGSTRQMFENGYYMIHNPWTIAMGNADEFSDTVQALRKEEVKLASFYAKVTGKPASDVAEMMATETEMDATEALSAGFITEIIHTVTAATKIAARKREYKAMVARLRREKSIKSHSIMKTSVLESAKAAFDSAIKALTPQVNAGMIQCEEGTLYFDGDEIAQDDGVYSDQEMTTPAPDGDYTKGDINYTVGDGKVTDIGPDEDQEDGDTQAKKPTTLDPETETDPEDPEKEKDDEDDAKKTIKDLQAELSKLKAARAKEHKEIKGIKAAAASWTKTMGEAVTTISELRALVADQQSVIAMTREEVKGDIKSSFIPKIGSRVTKSQKAAHDYNPFEKSIENNKAAKSAVINSR